MPDQVRRMKDAPGNAAGAVAKAVTWRLAQVAQQAAVRDFTHTARSASSRAVAADHGTCRPVAVSSGARPDTQ